ncbi:hypothetical protein EV178_003446 [Coemansia sp. RSA 1646]|nr:hypothetical protein EV178_003446 [Coemansia sp. RSA 1646]
MPCSYKLYIGLAKVASSTTTTTTGAPHRSSSSSSGFDIFSTPAKAIEHRFLAPFVDTPKTKHKRHAKRQAQEKHQQQLVSLLKSADYRFGRLQIEWWDSNRPAPGSSGLHEEDSQPMAILGGSASESARQGIPNDSKHGGPVGVFDLHPDCSATIPVGILRLYRCGKVHEPQKASTQTQTQTQTQTDKHTVLAVLAVPGYMTPTDFLSFTGPFGSTIEHVRAIRDDSPNHYMMVLKFRDHQSATSFYDYYNGKTFSPLEPEVCHIVHVSSIECEVRDVGASDTNYADKTVCATPADLFLSLSDGRTDDCEQLPTCPVCLERLDRSISGLLTTMCQHTFHCRCLARWGDGSCPVCRYTQTSPFVDHDRFRRTIADDGSSSGSNMASTSGGTSGPPHSSAAAAARSAGDRESTDASSCHVCGLTTDLWICLVCGTVGCGRYANAHAKAHFEQTQHPYSLELGSQRVWDYAGDGYVHRILQNMADRKVIALDSYHTASGPSASLSAQNSSVSGTNGVESGLPDIAADTGACSTSVFNRRRDSVGEVDCGFGESRPMTAEMAVRGASLAGGSFVDAREKLEAVTQEYEALLTSQLESQRQHYEMQVARLQHQLLADPQRIAALSAKNQELKHQYTELESLHRNMQAKLSTQDASTAAAAEEERRAWDAERKRLEANATKWVRKSTEDARLLAEERELVRHLMENQKALKAQIAELNTGMRDLEDQVRDMSFFISTQQKIADEVENGESIEGASLVGVAPPPPPPSTDDARAKGKGGKGKPKAKRRLPPRK